MIQYYMSKDIVFCLYNYFLDKMCITTKKDATKILSMVTPYFFCKSANNDIRLVLLLFDLSSLTS